MKDGRLRALKNNPLCFIREQHGSCTRLVAVSVSPCCSHRGTEFEGAALCSEGIVPWVGQALSSVVSVQERTLGRAGHAGLGCGIKSFSSLNHPVYLEEAAANSSDESSSCSFSGLSQGRSLGHVPLVDDRQRYTPGRLNSADDTRSLCCW